MTEITDQKVFTAPEIKEVQAEENDAGGFYKK